MEPEPPAPDPDLTPDAALARLAAEATPERLERLARERRVVAALGLTAAVAAAVGVTLGLRATAREAGVRSATRPSGAGDSSVEGPRAASPSLERPSSELPGAASALPSEPRADGVARGAPAPADTAPAPSGPPRLVLPDLDALGAPTPEAPSGSAEGAPSDGDEAVGDDGGDAASAPRDDTPDLATRLRLLLGRAPPPELEALAARGDLDGLRARAGDDALAAGWLEAELGALGLRGAFRPSEATVRAELTALRAGGDPFQCFQRLARGGDLRARFPGENALADAAIRRVLGLEGDDATLRPLLLAARHACAGAEDELLGARVRTADEVLALVSADPRAQVGVLRRAFRRLRGRDPAPDELGAALAAVRGDPRALFALLRAWGLP